MKTVFGLMTLLLLIVAGAPEAKAQARSCQLVYQLAEELRCSLGGTTLPDTASTPKESEFLITASYGPTQCKTGDVLKVAMKDLKEECATWLKERKADLGSKFQTGTCQEDCSTCPTAGLRNCTIRGTVHYAK